jgi:hypothetical protein
LGPGSDLGSFAGAPPSAGSSRVDAPLVAVQPPPGYAWLQVLLPTLTFTEKMDPLWVAQPGELYSIMQVEENWVLAVRQGSSSYWSVWIPLDSNVQSVNIDQAPPSVVDELWLVVLMPLQTYRADGDPAWTAESGEWYRVVFVDSDWVLALRENDSLENPVWISRSDEVELELLTVPGPGAPG